MVILPAIPLVRPAIPVDGVPEVVIAIDTGATGGGGGDDDDDDVFGVTTRPIPSIDRG